MNTQIKVMDPSTLLYHLAILTRRWRKVLDNEFQDDGLTDATWRPLLHLDILGDGIWQKDLAASVGIEGPSLVRLLDSLIAKGLIARSEDTSDRRAKRLSLTRDGKKVVKRIREVMISLENELLSSFTPEEIIQFEQLVLRLGSAVKGVRSRRQP